MRRNPLSSLSAALILLGGVISASADEGFNPFGEPETSRPAPRKPVEAEAPKPPLLAPMGGRVPEPSSGNSPPASPPGQYGMPYPSTQPAAEAPLEPAPSQQAPAPSQQAIVREPLPSGPLGPQDHKIERGDLAPVMSSDGTGLPFELWRGLSVNEIEALFASVEIPPRSPALHALWMRLITADAGSPGGGEQEQRMAALRAEALDRSGVPHDARELLLKRTTAADAVAQLIEARTGIELGEKDKGCDSAKALAGSSAAMPKRLKAEAIVLAGYCAAASGNLPGAGIGAEMARENGLDGALGPDMLDALALGAKPELPKGRKITLVDYRMLKLGGMTDLGALIPQASPALLAVLATEADSDDATHLAAAEAAAAANALKPIDLANIYRAGSPQGADGEDLGALDALSNDLAPRRATLFRAIEAEQTPQKKTRQIRAFLDSARRAGFYWPALQLMAVSTRTLNPAPEIGWFAETAIETALASGDFERARAWANSDAQVASPSGGDLRHWLALADIADAKLAGPRGANLDSVERLALTGRFDPVLLHRLATVLDALDTHIPVPLWEAASRTPQPSTGHLPDTGVLSALQEASKKKEFGHTVLLAMKTLGPTGAEGAHMIALGDSIRALKRAGLESEARALGLEALFATWPRGVSY